MCVCVCVCAVCVCCADDRRASTLEACQYDNTRPCLAHTISSSVNGYVLVSVCQRDCCAVLPRAVTCCAPCLNAMLEGDSGFSMVGIPLRLGSFGSVSGN